MRIRCLTTNGRKIYEQIAAHRPVLQHPDIFSQMSEPCKVLHVRCISRHRRVDFAQLATVIARRCERIQGGGVLFVSYGEGGWEDEVSEVVSQLLRMPGELHPIMWERSASRYLKLD